MVLETRWNDNWNLQQVEEEIQHTQGNIATFNRHYEEHLKNLFAFRDKLRVKADSGH